MALKEKVINILTDPDLLKINFSCMNCWVEGRDYKLIAEKIKQDRILVIHKPDLEGVSALYYQNEKPPINENTLVLKKNNFKNYRSKGLIIHESTHAIQDMKRQRLRKGNAEIAAYLAQIMYFVIKGVEPRFNNPTSVELKKELYETAKKILGGEAWRVDLETFYRMKILLGNVETKSGHKPYTRLWQNLNMDGN